MDICSKPAEEFINDESVEIMWAMKAYEHAEVYYNILCSVNPELLRFTPVDDMIYKIFRDEFPELNVAHLEEKDLKGVLEKEKWRKLCDRFKHNVEDYSFGTLIRLNASEGYSETNSILGPKIQFYAIELARNREGINNEHRRKPVISDPSVS